MDEYGDQAELEYIIEQGQLEAEQFGEWTDEWYGPARWVNPPTRLWTDGFAFYHPKDFINIEAIDHAARLAIRDFAAAKERLLLEQITKAPE